MKKVVLTTLSAFFLLTTSCGSKKNNEDSAQNQSTDGSATVYYNGDIITMEGKDVQYAKAVAVKDGKILFVGDEKQAMEVAGKDHKMIDLQGKTLLPGFIDAHGHVWGTGFQALSANLLPPPDGKAQTIPDLIAITNEWKVKNKAIVDKYKVIIGFGYDDAMLKEKMHPTANDLDKVSTDLPVIFMHQSGHMMTMSHKALEMAGYKKGTPDPKGGLIRRIEGTDEPSGTLEEMASFIPLFKLMSTLDTEANESIAKAGLESYMKFGFTTAQEGRATKDNCATWKKMADENKLPIDVVAYPDIQSQMDFIKEVGVQKDYTNHYRIGGVKLSLDGSLPGKTAWLTKPYVIPPTGQKDGYNGYAAIAEDETVDGLIGAAFENNWQIMTHCNGDAASDQYISALERATSKYGQKDRRPIMIHAQMVRPDQLDKMKILGIIPSYFSMHAYYWGDWHENQTIGEERAARIDPTGTTLKKDIIFTTHHDAPCAQPSSLVILYSTVNRTSRSGVLIGADERVSPYIALKSITDWAAYQTFEENIKGTLTKGKLADFVILDKNPIKIDPKEILNIKILETIKEGKTVYKNKS